MYYTTSTNFHHPVDLLYPPRCLNELSSRTSPLPATVTRDIALSLLHDHQSMIQLNPLVIEHHKCKPPKNASADEYNCTWYSLTDKISYLPGGMAKGHVTYNCCFHDLPMGIQTHCYAPMGLEIKEKWSVGGNMPGEPREIQELGLKGIPKEGLYIREDCDMVCNMLMTTYVKKTLKKAHSVLVERLLANGEHIEDKQYRQSMGSFLNRQSTVPCTYQLCQSKSRNADLYISKLLPVTKQVIPEQFPIMVLNHHQALPHTWLIWHLPAAAATHTYRRT